MVSQRNPRGTLVIIASFGTAMLLNILPLPTAIEVFRPDWVAMVLAYWVMALPNRVGVFVGWTVGLFVDVLNGSLLGVHALTLGVVAYLTRMIYHRLRLFPRWKQAINVAVVVGIHRLLTLLLLGLVTPIKADFDYWLPLVGVALFWPWVFIILRDVRRKFC